MPFAAMRLRGSSAAVVRATLSPTDKGSAAGIVLSEGNLRATVGPTPTAGRYYLARSTIGKAAGRWYWETVINRTGVLGTDYSYGSHVLCNGAYGMEQTSTNFPGLTATVAGGPFFGDGTYVNNVMVKPHSSAVGTFVIRHLLDMDAGTYEQAFGAGDFTTVMAGLTGTMFPAVMTREAATPGGTKGYAVQNFGQSPFVYSVPAGASAGLFESASP